MGKTEWDVILFITLVFIFICVIVFLIMFVVEGFTIFVIRLGVSICALTILAVFANSKIKKLGV